MPRLPQQDDLNKNDSYGYGDNDQRHRFVFSGYVTLPWDIQFGGVLHRAVGCALQHHDRLRITI